MTCFAGAAGGGGGGNARALLPPILEHFTTLRQRIGCAYVAFYVWFVAKAKLETSRAFLHVVYADIRRTCSHGRI